MELEKTAEISLKPIHQGLFDPPLALDMQNIPAKISFKIGEVADLLKLKPHILRYWEGEFESLSPRKRPNGQRLYFRKDVEMALLIKKLLYRDGFSVKGAKKALSQLKRENRQYRKQSSLEDKALKKVRHMQKTIGTIRKLIN